MEQAILAMLGIILTLMLYLDRGRRADIAQLRTETNEGFKGARAENAKISDDMNDGFKQVHSRLDKLTDVVMDLCRRVGRLEGRAEVSEPETDTPQ
ncbi:hypothetical protein [Candidatus Poriferisocius sp.]|uniref:hypothetical protein n=1 Tax=Candidatus Poriferisocius sp. TaxID=3101276 RepID=UPI003B52F6CC